MGEIENGCLWEWALQTDYLLDWLEDTLPELKEQDTKRFYYNQKENEWSKKSCTIFGSIGAISDLYNYEYPLSEVREVDDKSYKQWRNKGSGWYVWFAVDLSVKEWNAKHPDKKVAYYRIDISNKELVYKVLKKNYNIVTGYYANGNYTLDYSKDWVLNWTIFTPTTYGHCINLIMKNWEIRVKDNYKGTKYNEYKLENYPSDIHNRHATWYVITKVAEDNELELKKQNRMKVLLTAMINANSEMRHLSNDDKFKEILHTMNDFNRKKLEVVNEMLKKLVN